MSSTSVFSRTFVAASMATASRRAMAAAVALACTALMMPAGALAQGPQTPPAAIEGASNILRHIGKSEHPATQDDIDSASVNVAVQRITAEAAHDAFAASRRATLDLGQSDLHMKTAERMHAILAYEVANLNVMLAALAKKLEAAEKTYGKEPLLQYRALLESSSSPIDMRATEILQNATLHAQAMARINEGPGADVVLISPQKSAIQPGSQKHDAAIHSARH